MKKIHYEKIIFEKTKSFYCPHTQMTIETYITVKRVFDFKYGLRYVVSLPNQSWCMENKKNAINWALDYILEAITKYEVIVDNNLIKETNNNNNNNNNNNDNNEDNEQLTWMNGELFNKKFLDTIDLDEFITPDVNIEDIVNSLEERYNGSNELPEELEGFILNFLSVDEFGKYLALRYNKRLIEERRLIHDYYLQ